MSLLYDSMGSVLTLWRAGSYGRAEAVGFARIQEGVDLLD